MGHGTITKKIYNNYFIWKNYNEERMSVLSSLETSCVRKGQQLFIVLSLWMPLKTTRIWSFFDVWTIYVTPNCISLSHSRFILTFRLYKRCVLKNIDDIVIFACQLWPKHDFNVDLYLLQRKIWHDEKNINLTKNGGQIRFYLRIFVEL
jgi:hypothetical protein